MRALLDTNVLIDLFTERPPEGEEASKLAVMQELGDIELWVSAKSFTDVFYVMSKDNDSDSVQKTFLESLSFLKVCSVDVDDIRKAAERSWLDFEDCLIDVSAEKANVDLLLTRDRSGFSQSQIRALSPKELFAWLEEDLGITYDVIEW